MADTSSDKKNEVLLICTSPCVPPNPHELKERVSFLTIENSNFAWSLQDANPNRFNLYCGNELSTQHIIPSPQIHCLTQQAIHTIVKLRPVDELYEILKNSTNFQNSKALDDFFEYYNAEACAMCLLIICSQQQHNITEYDNVSSSFELLPIEGYRSKEIAQRAEIALSHYGGTPCISEPTTVVQGVGFHRKINLSIKYHGITKFISRIIAPLWKLPIVKLKDASNLQFYSDNRKKKEQSSFILNPSISKLQLHQIRELLLRLNNFINNSPELKSLSNTSNVSKNQQTPMTTPIRNPMSSRESPKRDGSHQAKKQEEDSLRNVFQLLERSIEAISLIYFFCYPIEGERSVIIDIPDSSIDEIKKLTFQELVCAKSIPIIQIIISSTIQFYSNTQDNVDHIAGILNQQCPSYFSYANMKLHRIIDKLNQIPDDNFPLAIEECTQSYKEIESISGEVDIKKVLYFYEKFMFYSGFVHLLLSRAKQLDPSNLASQGPSDDSFTKEKLNQRMECYQEIIRLYSNQTEFEQKRVILQATLGIDDKLCHRVLFSWYLQRIKENMDTNASRELLELHSPYLEEYLEQNDAELLYRFYCLRKRFGEAARVACSLSDRSLSIHSRIEWLVAAIQNEKACGGGTASGIDLHELTEKLDVAKIQLSIYNQIKSLPSKTVDSSRIKKALKALDAKLMDLTTVCFYLFINFLRIIKLILNFYFILVI